MFSFITISLFVLGIAAGPMYCYTLFNNQTRWSILISILLFAIGLGLAILIFFSTGTFFTQGITCLLFPLALITALIMLFWRRKQQDQLASDRSVRQLYWAGVILIPLILVLPFFELFWIRMACFGLNKHAAQPIIAALDEYKTDNEIYPEALDDLVPKHITAIPTGRCAPFSRSEYDPLNFEIDFCS